MNRYLKCKRDLYIIQSLFSIFRLYIILKSIKREDQIRRQGFNDSMFDCFFAVIFARITVKFILSFKCFSLEELAQALLKLTTVTF